MLILYSMAYHA